MDRPVERITAETFRRAFAKQWQQEISEKEQEILRSYSGNTSWTAFMLPVGGFLERVMNRISSSIEYRKEYYTVDALYVGGHDLLRKSELTYPSQLHVLIEHENGERVEEEMWKLIHWRAPLKVLIFYDYPDDEKAANPEKAEWLNKKLTKLREMLEAVDSFCPEDKGSEYLFIVGTLEFVGGPIYWKCASPDQSQPQIFAGSKGP